MSLLMHNCYKTSLLAFLLPREYSSALLRKLSEPVAKKFESHNWA